MKLLKLNDWLRNYFQFLLSAHQTFPMGRSSKIQLAWRGESKLIPMMDVRRETWLREKVLVQVETINVLQELPLGDGNIDGDEEAVLDALDTYLCDIKEAQIRHGLHILGALPETAKLANTIVALLRLPRGTSPHSQGILHVLANDFGLDYNPSEQNTEAWTGKRPGYP